MSDRLIPPSLRTRVIVRLGPLMVVAFFLSTGLAQSGPDLLQKSVPLRTALHHDPTLAAPLTALVKLYRDATSTDELVTLYRRHLDQWPQDAGAQTVLVRVLHAVGDPEAGPAVTAAAKRLPDVPFLQYLLYEHLDADADPAALDALDRAISLEKSPSRRRQWIELLVPKAATQQRDDLLDRHLDTLSTLVADSPQGAADVAAIMIRHARYERALALLGAALQQQPAPEVMVQLELLAADAEVGQDRAADAGGRLETLLGKVAHDYWRRDEILRRRIALVTDAGERQALIDQARKRVADHPENAKAILDLARLLEGLELRRDALDVLVDAGARLPKSPQIEAATLALFDVLRDDRGRAAYLAQRLELQPERDDLAERYTRTLFLLGRRDEATRVLTPRLAAMAEGPRLNRLLELARFLRRSAMTRDSVDLFTQAVALAPQRLDVRRELAEVYLVLNRKREATALFAEPLPPDAAIENLLDLVGLLIEKGMYPEARRVLRDRMPAEPVNLELRLLLLGVEGELGAVRSGLELSIDARRLADTAARYRSWLEATLRFHDGFDTASTFLDAEFETLRDETAALATDDVERRMVFADVVDRGPMADAVHDMLRQTLADSPESLALTQRLEVRRALIASLTAAAKPEQFDELKAHLAALAADDPTAHHEAQARLAVLMAGAGRHQDIGSLLETIDPTALDDARLLESLAPLLTQHGKRAKLGDLYERITQVDPANRGAWENWLTSLALRGDEDRLRLTIRRLMAGIDRMPLSEESQATLARGLTDSSWRSIARLLAMEGEAPAADALALLAAAGRMSTSDAQAMWVTWCRGCVLKRLGRDAERDQALDELDRLAKAALPAEVAAPAMPALPTVIPRVTFPSGLSMSIDTARRMLTGPLPWRTQAESTEALSGPRGPIPDGDRVHVAWRFDTPGQVPVLAVIDPGKGRLLLVDAAGTLWAIDAATGKLLWQREGAIAPAQLGQTTMMATHPQWGRHQMNVANAIATPTLDVDRLYCVDGGVVVCLSTDDGRVLWRTLPLAGTAASSAGTAPMNLTVYRGRLWAYEPLAHTLLAIARDTGKLTDEWRLSPSDAASPLSGTPIAATCGAWRSGSMWFVYGTSASIVDLDRREEVWSFASTQGGQFPLRLESPEDRENRASVSSPASTGQAFVSFGGQSMRSSAMMHGRLSRHPTSGPVHVQHVNMMQPNLAWGAASPQTSVALTLPANAWADLSSLGGQPRLGIMSGDRLLLAGAQGSLLLPLDLPLSGTPASVDGTFIGLHGSHACFLDAGELMSLDMQTGEVQQSPVESVRGEQTASGARLGGVIDGAVAYVTGPAGIRGINVVTGRRIFDAAWPDDVIEAMATPPQPRHGTAAATNLNYTIRGISAMVPDQGTWGPMLPPIDCITANGLLISSPVPGRILAAGVPRHEP
jgi:tetratricopeptide (TPR) repeat protein